MKNNKLLFISQEITPYLAETPLSVLGKQLPVSMQERGFEVRTFMPKYGCINERRNQLHEVIRLSGMNIIINDTDHPLIIKVATLQPSRMQVYFIDSDDYFNSSTGASSPLETVSLPEENHERMLFYVRGVVETVKKLRWEPAVVQCIGWLTALAPLFLKRMMADDPSFTDSKVIYTLRSESFEGALDQSLRELLTASFAHEDIDALGDGPVTAADLHRIAIEYADAIVQGDADVDPELIEKAKATGKPFVAYNPDFEAFSDANNALYRSLLGEETEED
ncbi:MAG: glycogen/starch synthase [Paramuribaculum sp.]|nr:glycogen/starch synthase [Paramuribaculum sp.]